MITDTKVTLFTADICIYRQHYTSVPYQVAITHAEVGWVLPNSPELLTHLWLEAGRPGKCLQAWGSHYPPPLTHTKLWGLCTWKPVYSTLVYPQTEVQRTCSVAECTLHVHCKLNSVAAVYTAHAVYFSLCSVVVVYTAQSMQSMYSVHCSYPAATLHVHCTSVWVIWKRQI